MGRPANLQELARRAEGFRTFTRAIDQLEQLADPVLVDMASRYDPQRLIAKDNELPQSWRPVRTLLEDPAAWYAGYLGVRGDFNIPMELRQDLRERVPQANLRDTYRIIHPEDYVDRRPVELGLDPGGQEGMKEAKAALQREPLPLIEPLVEEVMFEQARRRRFLAEPWPTYIDDDAPREYREIIE